MGPVCQELPFAFVYLDDILVASRNQEEHHEHLGQLFHKLQAAGLILNVEKCVFGKQSLRFLGHEVPFDCIKPTGDGIEAIVKFPCPEMIRWPMSSSGW